MARRTSSRETAARWSQEQRLVASDGPPSTCSGGRSRSPRTAPWSGPATPTSFAARPTSYSLGVEDSDAGAADAGASTRRAGRRGRSMGAADAGLCSAGTNARAGTARTASVAIGPARPASAAGRISRSPGGRRVRAREGGRAGASCGSTCNARAAIAPTASAATRPARRRRGHGRSAHDVPVGSPRPTTADAPVARPARRRTADAPGLEYGSDDTAQSSESDRLCRRGEDDRERKGGSPRQLV